MIQVTDSPVTDIGLFAANYS